MKKQNLEAFWLYCLLVSGKNADFASNCLSRIMSKVKDGRYFDYFRDLGETQLRNHLVAWRCGQYQRLTRAITESLSLDLETASVETLENIYGVGPKTARFFVLYTREDAQVAVLDTHILKWLKAKRPNTPNQYTELERKFLTKCRVHFPGVSIREVDLLLWSMYSGRLIADVLPTIPGVSLVAGKEAQ